MDQLQPIPGRTEAPADVAGRQPKQPVAAIFGLHPDLGKAGLGDRVLAIKDPRVPAHRRAAFTQIEPVGAHPCVALHRRRSIGQGHLRQADIQGCPAWIGLAHPNPVPVIPVLGHGQHRPADVGLDHRLQAVVRRPSLGVDKGLCPRHLCPEGHVAVRVVHAGIGAPHRPGRCQPRPEYHYIVDQPRRVKSAKRPTDRKSATIRYSPTCRLDGLPRAPIVTLGGRVLSHRPKPNSLPSSYASLFSMAHDSPGNRASHTRV